MVSEDLYLPHLLQDVVSKVSDVFDDRTTDDFNVYFRYGIYQDVWKGINKDADVFPLIYLVMHIEETKDRRLDLFSEVTCDLFIAMPTQNDYTMAQREELIFFPRLYPIYEELFTQLKKSKWFISNAFPHKKIDRFYWGGNEVGTDTKNMWDRFIDAVQIKGLELKIKNIC